MAGTLLGSVAALVLLAGTARAGPPAIFSPVLFPLHYQNESGVAEGYSIDILHQLLKANGMYLRRGEVHFSNLARTLADAAPVSNALVVGLARSKRREGAFRWVGPIVHLRLGLVVMKGHRLDLDDPQGFKGLRIAVIRSSVIVPLIRRCFGQRGAEVQEVPSFANQFKMLEHGRVDAVIHADLTTPRTLQSLGLSPEDYEMACTLLEADLYFALSPDADPDLVEAMQLELDRLNALPGKPLDALLQRHLGVPLEVLARPLPACVSCP